LPLFPSLDVGTWLSADYGWRKKQIGDPRSVQALHSVSQELSSSSDSQHEPQRRRGADNTASVLSRPGLSQVCVECVCCTMRSFPPPPSPYTHPLANAPQTVPSALRAGPAVRLGTLMSISGGRWFTVCSLVQSVFSGSECVLWFRVCSLVQSVFSGSETVL
jgi:hypothetical protein